MSQEYLKAKKLEQQLLQIIEQPHTNRRLAIAIFPAPYEIETPAEFVFSDQLDKECSDEIRQAVIKAMQHQITRHFTRHASLKTELEQRQKELEREENQHKRRQLDLWQSQNLGKEALQTSTGAPVRLDEFGNPFPDIAPF